jgi:hypothetical protein
MLFKEKPGQYRIHIHMLAIGLVCGGLVFLFANRLLLKLFSSYSDYFLEALAFVALIDFCLWRLFGKNVKAYSLSVCNGKRKVQRLVFESIGLNVLCSCFAVAVILFVNWMYTKNAIDYFSGFDVECLGISVKLIWRAFLLSEIAVIFYACHRTHNFSGIYFVTVCNAVGVIGMLIYLNRIMLFAHDPEQARSDASQIAYVYIFALLIMLGYAAYYFFTAGYRRKRATNNG